MFMAKTSNKVNIVAILFLTVPILLFYIFNADQASASPGTVEFTADAELSLTGLDTTTYIASGSKADSLTISGSDLNVYGVWDGIAFQLKTSTSKVLQLTTSGGTADLVFSSNNVSGGYISQWTITSSVSVNQIIGVPSANTYYDVKADGASITGSPFDSGASKEVTFSRVGGGIYTIEEVVIPLDVETLSATDITVESATLRGRLTDIGQGDTVYVWFKWGADQSLIETTLEQTMTGLGIFRAGLSGLIEGQTYYFQAIAENREAGILIEGELVSSFVARDSIFITVMMGGRLRVIEVDQEGRIIIRKE